MTLAAPPDMSPIKLELQRLNPLERKIAESGKAGYALLWLLGVPIPVLLFVYALRGCN